MFLPISNPVCKAGFVVIDQSLVQSYQPPTPNSLTPTNHQVPLVLCRVGAGFHFAAVFGGFAGRQLAQRAQVFHAVGEEHAVQVVDLVLQAAGIEAVGVDLDRLPSSVWPAR